MRPPGGPELVVLASAVSVGTVNVPNGLASLGVGLVGVALARWVFVNKQNRTLARREKWHETLPLTLTAMLIAGAIIWDRHPTISAAAFIGLGVGWAAVLLLDLLGERVTAGLRGALGAGPASPAFPKVADHSGHDGKVDSGLVDPDHPADGGPSFAKLVDKLDEEAGE